MGCLNAKLVTINLIPITLNITIRFKNVRTKKKKKNDYSIKTKSRFRR